MFREFSVIGYRITGLKCLTLCLGYMFIIGCFIASLDTVPSESTNPRIITPPRNKKLAILVPFRERFEELLEFVPHMFKFLNNQNISFHIFIIQQKDDYRFNRASLVNVGFIYTRKDYDYIAMHDVDLLPLNDNLSYKYPKKGPYHISSPETHPKYHYEQFIGAILLIKKKDFELVHGMSNNYWGWGLEDDEFYVRLKDAGLKVGRPVGITTGTENTFKHIHREKYRKRDTRNCYNQLQATRRRDRRTGIHDVAYNIYSSHNVSIDSLPITVINVELLCDKTVTPWCQCPKAKFRKPNKHKLRYVSYGT